jgi:hypothetical protein
MQLDPVLGRAEPDTEIRDLIKASGGLNLALDYLPGSITFDPVAGPAPAADEASEIVCFDAYVTNVDRTPKNPNMLHWHRALWLIDHGAALYFHHSWAEYLERSRTVFAPIKDHVLLPWATALPAAEATLRGRLTPEVLERTVALIPDEWLGAEESFSTQEAHRGAYLAWLRERLEAVPRLIEEAERARAQLI